jgi:hypothetical protein
VDTDNEVDGSFETPDILTDTGVMQMEMVMMNEGLKGHMVDEAVVVLYIEWIQHLLPNLDGLDSPSEVEQQVEEDLEFVLRHQQEGRSQDHQQYQLEELESQLQRHAAKQVQVGY